MSYNEPIIDEYGFANFGTGDLAIPSEYFFEDGYRFDKDGEPIHEFWKEVQPGYWISSDGALYSQKTNAISKPKRLDREGHVGYCLSNGKNKKYVYQHRLIAQNYIPKEQENFNVVRHLNGVPDDNDPSNLDWGTQKENWRDSYEQGHVHLVTPEEREIGLTKMRKPTRATNIKTGEVREYRSLNDAVEDIGVQQANAHKTITGKRKHTCGWHFEYI